MRAKKPFIKKDFEIYERNAYGLRGLNITRVKYLNDKKKKGKNSKEYVIEKIKKRIQKYDYSNAVITADAAMASYLEMDNIMFQARKQELMNNVRFVLEAVQKKSVAKGDGDDKKALIVIDSTNWSIRELFLILTSVKNCYRKISIVVGNYDKKGLERIKNVMYEEWGVVIDIYDSIEMIKSVQDMVFFFVRDWKKWMGNNILWHAGYIVSEKEPDNCRRIIKEHIEDKVIYSGLVYKKEDILPYQVMVNMAWQKPLFFKNFHVSIIDIYALE